MKWKKLERTIYPCTVYFCQGGTASEVKAKMKRLGLIPDEEEKQRGQQLGFTLKMTDKNDRLSVLIWVKSAKRNPRDVSILGHECEHATYAIFQHIGLEGAVLYDDQEVHAYLIGYLLEEALEFFWQKPRFDVSFGFE
ncbi:MAG: hypothetical protein COV96_00810 [Candidatus Zambryskibacteria bacterium CG11_big_fil_rev_8_21_14_0_20_42_18]|nr:MAG: hypothetical protein COV96_00810 [Candidatus Zambryskibacteria bacterium CG11_big_fil_rev_8_21_14_0_20_42_18]